MTGNYPHHQDIWHYCDCPELAKIISRKSFRLINLNKFEDEELVKHGASGVMEVYLKQASREEFPEWLASHQELMRELPIAKYLDLSTNYALDVSKEENPEVILNILSDVYPNLKETIMSAAQRLEQRGEIRGIELGSQNSKLEIAMNMLREKFAIGIIEKITGLDRQTIEQLSL